MCNSSVILQAYPTPGNPVIQHTSGSADRDLPLKFGVSLTIWLRRFDQGRMKQWLAQNAPLEMSYLFRLIRTCNQAASLW